MLLLVSSCNLPQRDNHTEVKETPIEKLDTEWITKQKISMNLLSWSTVKIYSLDRKNELYSVNMNNEWEFLIDFRKLKNNLVKANIHNPLIWVTFSGGTYKEYKYSNERDPMKGILIFLLSYEKLEKSYNYDFSILNQWLSQMVAQSDDINEERMNFFRTQVENMKDEPNKSQTLKPHIDLYIDWCEGQFMSICMNDPQSYIDPMLLENMNLIRIDDKFINGSTVAISFHKFKEQDFVYYSTWSRVSDMEMLPNEYKNWEIIILKNWEILFFSQKVSNVIHLIIIGGTVFKLCMSFFHSTISYILPIIILPLSSI